MYACVRKAARVAQAGKMVNKPHKEAQCVEEKAETVYRKLGRVV